MERPGAMTLRGNPFTLIGPELKVGDKAPEFEALDGSLKPVTLATTGNSVRVFSVVPSLDTDVALKGSELQAYEERFLFLLLLLRQPRARLVYVTGQAIHPSS